MTEHVDRDASTRVRLWRYALNLVVSWGLLPIVLIVLYVVFGLIEPRFHSLDNFVNILRQASYLIMLATGQMIVLITRGFDLSLGTVISMISVASALVMVGVLEDYPGAVGLAILLAILLGLGVGLTVGAVNGMCVSLLRVNPFVVTLGTQGIALGFATTLSGGFPVFGLPEVYTNIFSRMNWLGVPAPVAVCIIVLATVYFVLNHTLLGRGFYLLGGNPRAAHVAGLSMRLNITGAYVLCSVIVAVVALMLTARTGTGEPALGGELMLQSIAAAVIGGVSLRGGEGRILHCVLGGLFITILSNGMNFARVDSYIQMIVLGAVLISAVFFDRLRSQIR